MRRPHQPFQKTVDRAHLQQPLRRPHHRRLDHRDVVITSIIDDLGITSTQVQRVQESATLVFGLIEGCSFGWWISSERTPEYWRLDMAVHPVSPHYPRHLGTHDRRPPCEAVTDGTKYSVVATAGFL